MTATTRVRKLERDADAELRKHRGCTDDEKLCNFLYTTAKKLETTRFYPKGDYPAWVSLSTLEREWLDDLLAIARRPDVLRDDPIAPRVARFCAAALRLPTNEAENEYPCWARLNAEGRTVVTNVDWILATGLGEKRDDRGLR